MHKAQFRWNGQDHIFEIGEKLRLDLGCGWNRHKLFMGVDKRDCGYPDNFMRYDLEDIPWPLTDESCSVLLLNHAIEHIKPWLTIDFMNECWRVLEFGGLLVLITPYGMSPRHFYDPTHCNPWVQQTVYYFIPGNELYDVYKPKQWEVEVLTFHPENDLGFAIRKVADITPEQDKEIRKSYKELYKKAYDKENTLKVERTKI